MRLWSFTCFAQLLLTASKCSQYALIFPWSRRRPAWFIKYCKILWGSNIGSRFSTGVPLPGSIVHAMYTGSYRCWELTTNFQEFVNSLLEELTLEMFPTINRLDKFKACKYVFTIFHPLSVQRKFHISEEVTRCVTISIATKFEGSFVHANTTRFLDAIL